MSNLHYLVREPKVQLNNPPLLILLHGYGSNEHDLFSFASELPEELLIISAQAPYSMGFGGYAWYAINFDDVNGKFSDIPQAKESIKKIQGAKGYTAFVESMALNEKSEEAEITEDTVNDYVAKFTKSTFEESLKDILPLVHRVNEEEMENNRANQIERVKEIILATDKKTGEKKNKISFPGRSDGYDFEKIKSQYAKPTNAADAAQQKILQMALQFDDLADRVDVDTIDDKKRKNKGHDRAAELSNFLHDFANEMRDNPKALNKQKVALAGHLMKLSKQASESVEENTSLEEKFDTMIAEAFSGFNIPA